MYERSAIVLERYFDNLLNYRRECNLRDNYNNYCDLVEKLEKYQVNYQKELVALQEYNESLEKIKEIQATQKSLYKKSAKLEYNRNLLFNNLDGKVEDIKKCIEKIEAEVSENNTQMDETKESLLGALEDFNEKKFELSKCRRYKKMAENDYNEIYEISRTNFDGITESDIEEAKAFAKYDDEESIIEVLTENGKNEKIPFNEEIIKCVTKFGIEVAKKEVATYLIIYDKMEKLLEDIDNGVAKISLHQKYARNEKAKVDFILAVKEYETQFLDYERMTVIHGRKSHNRLMSEAAENFNTDIVQIDNLYELLLKEIANKATKKAYKELYNKTYLTDIKEKEEKFKKEKNRVNLNTATLINSNYWRIEGIKGIYTVFYKNVSEVFGRDVAEFDIPKEFDSSVNQDSEVISDEEEEEKEEVKAVEKIPFQIEGYDNIVEVEQDEEELPNYYQIDDDDDDIEDTYQNINEDDDDDDNDYDDDEENEEERFSSTETLIDNTVNKMESDFEEEFDIFGEKYRDTDFLENNVIAAKSNVEEEIVFPETKITRTQNKVQTKNVFKKVEFDDEEEDVPYEVEEEEELLFDDLKKAQRKNSNYIEDFDLTKETPQKNGGMFKKLRKISGTKKNNIDDIW